MIIFACYNQKGGVGKTATAVNLAFLSARAGARTLVWDLDPQGATSFYLRTRAEIDGSARRLIKGKLELTDLVSPTEYDGLDILPADPSYRHMDMTLEDTKKPLKRFSKLLKGFSGTYDYVLLDCPAGLSLVSESVLKAADVLLIPVVPTPLSLRTHEQLRAHLKGKTYRHLFVAPFFSMVDRRKKLHRTITDLHANGANGFLETNIPFASIVEQMGLRQAPLPAYDRRSVATKAYRALWKETNDKLALQRRIKKIKMW